MAEGLGFRATIEKPILDGQGSIDLLLERGDTIIACEISVTTSIDHEVGNVRKCLKAGFPSVAVICVDEERLQRIATAVSGSLGPEMATRVLYCQADQFIAHLKSIPTSVPPPATPKSVEAQTSHGYKIKRTRVTLPPEELRAQDEAGIKAIAEAMRRKGR